MRYYSIPIQKGLDGIEIGDGMQPPSNERELIERAKNGDKEAVSALYESYAQAIFQYISYRVESDMIAEDLTADVFLRMVRGLPRYKYTGAPVGAWLYRVAANRIADHYRKGRHETSAPILDSYRSDTPEPFDEMARQEERTHLREALQTLSEDYQNIIILRFMKELPHAEVAEIMGKSEAAVRVLQHRGLKALADKLQNPPHSERKKRGNDND